MRLQNCSECLTKLRSVTPDNRLIWKDKRVCIQCFKKLHSQDVSLPDRSTNSDAKVCPDAAVKVAS